jgi:hypothetical protein
MTETEVKEYVILKTECENKLKSFESKLLDFAEEFKTFTSGYLDTSIGKKRMEYYDGYVSSVWIEDGYEEGDYGSPKIHIYITNYEIDDDNFEFPISILWNENWKEYIANLYLEKWKDEINKELDKRKKTEQDKEKHEKKEYERLKKKYGDNIK